jgi:hypothetical protein
MSLPGLLVLVLVVGAGLWSAAAIVRRLLGESNPLIVFGLAIMVATVFQGFGLLWLPMLLPAGWSSAVAAASLVALAFAIRRLVPTWSPVAERQQSLAIGPVGLAVIAGVSICIYISALAFWFEGTAGGADVATEYLHSGLVATIGRGNFPVVNPFEPDFFMTYRFSVHTLASATQNLLGIDVPTVLPHFLGALGVGLFLGTLGVVARLTRNLNAGIFAGLLLWGWGPLYWLGLPAYAAREGLGEAVALVARSPEAVTWSGVFLGPTFTMATHNPTNIFGFFPALASLWLVLELADSGQSSRGRAALLGLLVITLTLLAAASEYFFAAVAAAIVGYGVLMMWRLRRSRWWLPALPIAGLIPAAALALTTSSVLGGIFRGDRAVLQLGVYLNSAAPGSYTSWGYNSGGPLFYWSNPDQHEVSLLSWEYLVDGGLITFLLLAIAITGAARPDRPAFIFALAGAAGALAATVFHFESSPPDIYRFAHFGAGIGFVALGIWGATRLRAPGFSSRARRVVLSAVGGLSLVAFLLSSIAWPGMIAQAETADSGADGPAIEFLLAEADVTDGLLVLWGSRTAYDLYDSRNDQITARISAATGQFIPYGYHHLSHAQEYSSVYGWAQETLREEYLDELGIRFIYHNPNRATDQQRAALQRLLATDLIAPVLESTIVLGEPRILYEYSPAGDRRTD